MRTTCFVVVVSLLPCIGCATEPAGTLQRLDPAQPFRIEFGRGSGSQGLDTVALTHDCNVTLHRRRDEKRENAYYLYWETTTLKLPKAAIAELLAEIEKQGVLSLNREYHNARIADGTQWVFWAQQGDKETAVYCNNKFPKPLKRFAETLDATLGKNGLDKARWERVPDDESGQHDADLWDSIK